MTDTIDLAGGKAKTESQFTELYARFRAASGPLIQSFLNSDERARAKRNAVMAFAVRVVSAALLYATQIILARWMGSFEYGLYVFVWSWVLLLGGLAPLGLSIVLIRLVPEYRELGKIPLLQGLVFASRTIAVVVGTAVAGLGLLSLWLFEAQITNHYVLPLYLALVCVPLFALGDVQDGLGRGQAWMGLGLIPPYILRPSLVLACMIAAHIAGLPMAATTAAGAAIAATWISALVQMLLLDRKMAETVRHVTREYNIGLWLKMAAPLLVINACELLLQNTDVIIISAYLSPTEVGIYFAAAKTMSLILFVHYAVGSAAANRFSALKARGDEQGLKMFVRDSVNWTFWPSLFAAALILALGKPLLSLFGPQFEAGYPVMMILVAGFLFRSAMGPAEFLLNMLGEQVRCASVLVATAVLNVALNLFLVPQYGMVGAASATSASLIVAALLQYLVVRRRLGLDVSIASIWLSRRNTD